MTFVKRERVVEFIGASDEQVAWLRLSLRRAGDLLRDAWRLRRDGDVRVDLMMVPHVDEGASATSLSQVRLIDPTMAIAMQVLAWPLSKELLVEQLNRVGAEAPHVPPTQTQAKPAPAAPGAIANKPAIVPPAPPPLLVSNIYDDLYEDTGPLTLVDIDQIEAGPDAPWLALREEDSELTREAERLFKRDIDPEIYRLRSIRLDDRLTQIEPRSEPLPPVARNPSPPPASVPVLDPVREDADRRLPFSAYLGRVLSTPAQLNWQGLVVTLDPRARKYHAVGGLCLFDALCRSSVRRGDWHALSGDAMDSLRAKIPGRPFLELQWLCAYLVEGAGSELNERMNYRLIDRIDLNTDYPPADRVAKALSEGGSLALVALKARVPLPLVRRVAAAFDELGWLVPA